MAKETSLRVGSEVKLHTGHGKMHTGKIVKLYAATSDRTKRKTAMADVAVNYKVGDKSTITTYARRVKNLARA